MLVLLQSDSFCTLYIGINVTRLSGAKCARVCLLLYENGGARL